MKLKVGLPVQPVFAALLGILAPLPVRGNPPTDPVAVASSSTAEYAQQKFGAGGPKSESYLFFQGKFYGGTTRDPDLEKTQFNQIAKVLAQNMVNQRYIPSKDVKNADLLIVVHWGQTTTDVEANYNDDNTRLGELSLGADQQYAGYVAGKTAVPPNPGPVNDSENLVDAEEAVIMKQVRFNSKLLGFDGQFAKDAAAGGGSATTNAPTDVNHMLQDLQEIRYFVVLMAYDYPAMKKGSTPKLLWSTRFSIRAPGNTFTACLPVMARTASDYFGRAIDGLKIIKPLFAVPEGKVDFVGPNTGSPRQGD